MLVPYYNTTVTAKPGLSDTLSWITVFVLDRLKLNTDKRKIAKSSDWSFLHNLSKFNILWSPNIALTVLACQLFFCLKQNVGSRSILF